VLEESSFAVLGARLVLAGDALGLAEVLESPLELVSSDGDFSSSCARAGTERPARDRKRTVKQNALISVTRRLGDVLILKNISHDGARGKRCEIFSRPGHWE
jgi:hypothetical protein